MFLFDRARARALCLGLITSIFLTAAAAIPHSPAFADILGRRSPPKVERIARPRLNSVEYRLNWGLAAIKADRAYAQGANGRGVTVAMIDTGIDSVPARLFGRVSDASIDLVPNRMRGSAKATHGEQTASLLAAALDGQGTVGVAYGANLLAIRADIDGSCESECGIYSTDLARGIDYALAQGARIIGIPLVGQRRFRTIEPALERAVKAGAVIVAAAGNDGGAAPHWPARYAADPRFAPAILVAGASTWRGTIADWSNKAAGVEQRFIAAPGERVVVDCDVRYCHLASGTSYSVAYVAGALSLVMGAHLEMSAQDAARILLQAASDRGPAGADAVTGTGTVDVARALQASDRGRG